MEINNKNEEMGRCCIDELKGIFSGEQSLKIILGITAMKWISENKKYSSSIFDYEKILKKYNIREFIVDELNDFEEQYPEFKGLLTTIFDIKDIYIDNLIINKIKNIIDLIYNFRFDCIEEITEFANKLITIAGAYAGIYETPIGIKKLVVNIIDFINVKRFADYCSGVSGMAIDIQNCIKKNNISNDIYYYGEEINPTLYLISKILLIMNENNNFEVKNIDVLENKNNNNEFDFIFSDSPQSMSWDNKKAYNDLRFEYGIPTRTNADWAFYQNVLYHLNSNGIGIVIGTKGTLVRSIDYKIRKKIIEKDLIEAVITLPTNLYETRNVGTEMIIFNMNKSEEIKNKILFINASEYSQRLNRNQYTISEAGINKIVKNYKNKIEEKNFSKNVSFEKIKEYGFTINPIEYLDFDVLKKCFEKSITLGEIAQIMRGVQVSKKDLEILSEYPTHYFLNIKDIDNGKVNYDENTRITNKRKDWLGKYDIKKEDILITSKGWNIKIAIVEEDFRPAFISGNLSIIRVNPQKYNAYVLYEFLQSEIGLKMLEGIQTGTTIKILNNPKLAKIEVPVFDIEHINEVGFKIKQNKIEYEKSITDAEIKFKDTRKKLLENLGFK
ncbi:N-6 DNA methylase [Clostridium felsineum]|uniref:site-specific DNA-methyltransferase (adenine-specific) n=1 Tax=Clostridium felsineum TaxID=36839 RepID=A0A1S8L9A2_9CLOT|nr:N-6 DNA methylase [Clostridium felsineum]URZ05171.1 hypothetical protein CLROS_004950 [Clostridium felsineum]URZ10212.1 hypothetical protein CROST_009200 [Clostridium felsineum]